ncbi:MAG: hypothetical protein ASARMPREDX12_005966 [Alectoria sarmentosa]|nr:MAG: hypothetical protein ASARMPREDX12_005966 [Alectoria sarmentosa]CAD6593599.1 MAG: hypothetical protein ASARMPRED_007731 [Alectoria sarmentosa]
MTTTMTSTMEEPTKNIQENLEANYTSHPSELVKDGVVSSKYTSQDLRNAIPARCFEPSYFWSFFYLARDLLVAGTLMYASYNYIPLIPFKLGRYAAWATYGYFQGQQMTGIWVIGHECGHGGFSKNDYLNDTIGWITHSALMTPYFSWQSTHRRHHIYANNLIKDHNYVPITKGKYATLMGVDVEEVAEMAEDSPLYTLGRIVMQQVVGFPWYLIANITATQGSLANKNPQSKYPLGNSHLSPSSALFRPEEWHLILASDIGLGLTVLANYVAAQYIGWEAVCLLYVMPYMWVNHWIVAITYLHHTHPDVPKYEPEAWTFLKGATATIDRELGFGGKHLMHNIAEYHVIHHLFSRIPQYYAEEATKAIMPLLGESYHEDKKRNFWALIWESFTQCQYVEPDDPNAKPADRAMYYKAGPSPPIEITMGRSGLKSE